MCVFVECVLCTPVKDIVLFFKAYSFLFVIIH